MANLDMLHKLKRQDQSLICCGTNTHLSAVHQLFVIYIWTRTCLMACITQAVQNFNTLATSHVVPRTFEDASFLASSAYHN